jgi:metal-responsive CopG/Arc/MetJ family transcriptional regulator
MSARKLATSLPREQFESLEQARKKLHLRRSEAIQEALALWLSARAEDAKGEAYIRGYLAHPDDPKETRAFVAAWARGVEPEDW